MIENIRKHSLTEAALLGYPINNKLPALDDVGVLKNLLEITDRFLCLYAVVACSYGFSKEKALEWLCRESLIESLSKEESQYLNKETDKHHDIIYQWKIESLWALAWYLELHEDLKFANSCSDEFIQLLPTIAKNDSTSYFRKILKVRSYDELLKKTDLAYCLSWAVRETKLKGMKSPGKVPGNVIFERRRTLEWILGQEDWDEVQLDT